MASKPGAEFVGGKGFAPLFVLTHIAFAGLAVIALASLPFVNLASLPPGATLVLIIVITTLMPLCQGLIFGFNTPSTAHDDYGGFANGTDTRYRIRVVSSPKRAPKSAALKPMPCPTEEQLRYTTGGFEPVIRRAVLAIPLSKKSRRLAILVGVAATLAAVTFHGFSEGFVLHGASIGIFAYAYLGLGFATGPLVADALEPVYLRLSPGRLDVMRFHSFSNRPPTTTTYDLRQVGLCVDFNRANVALEPRRPPGEPTPPTVLSKSWPYNKAHAEGHRPDHLFLILTPGKRTFMEKLVQAARVDPQAALPALPDDALLD